MYTPIKILSNRKNYGDKRSLSDIKYIVIHYTANNGDKAENNGKYFHNNVVKASAHYFIDSNTIVQSVPDNYIAWSVGGTKYPNTKGGKLYGKATNKNTLNIELCCDVKNNELYPTDKCIEKALKFVENKMSLYDIPKKRVIRHYDVTGKLCPKYWVNDTRWKKEFRKRLNPKSNKKGLFSK